MKNLLKNGRISKGLTVRKVSGLLGIDQALVSKFENGQRNPTRKQILQLAELYEIASDELLLAWLKNKLLFELVGETLAVAALKSVLLDMEGKTQNEPVIDPIEKLLSEMENLKSMLGKKKPGKD